MQFKNKVQLITYPDSLGGNLTNLEHVLDTYFPDSFQGGVHILPPFPSSGDRGFAPLTYTEIAPEFGSWNDISRIGKKYPIALDLMVNHISAQSIYFNDFLKNGERSPYKDMFITLDKIWPDAIPKQQDLEKIYLRRDVPFSTYTSADGKPVTVWTTFGPENPSEQVDLDIHSSVTKKILREFLENFGKYHVSLVRLDAVGFVNKVAGTSCFFLEPEIYNFIDDMHDIAAQAGIKLLPEVHAHYEINFKLAQHGCFAYDFCLPYLILNALLNKTSGALCDYLKRRPKGMITMLDCHDGIPVKPDLDGLYVSGEAKRVAEICASQGADFSRLRTASQKDPDGFDVHQICCTYYSALGCNDDLYIAARALQLFSPGIPQVYYVGLLAGINDPHGVEISGDRRALNRHNYTLEEIALAVKQPVVQRLMRLIDYRNSQIEFDGDFETEQSGCSIICLRWNKDGHSSSLNVDLLNGKTTLIREHQGCKEEIVL